MNTLVWNGSIAPGASSSISIEVRIEPTAPSRTSAVQGLANFDLDGDGANDAFLVTDDPTTPEPEDPTVFEAVIGARIEASKTVTPVSGNRVTYTVTLKNQSPIDQPDNPGPEFIDELPDELILEGVAADSGIAESQGNRAIWNGPIEGQGQVILSIEACLRTSVSQGQVISNQGTVFFDSNGLGFNESDALTTDPETGGATAFATGAEIPLLSDLLLPLLTLLLTGAGVYFLRSR